MNTSESPKREPQYKVAINRETFLSQASISASRIVKKTYPTDPLLFWMGTIGSKLSKMREEELRALAAVLKAFEENPSEDNRRELRKWA